MMRIDRPIEELCAWHSSSCKVDYLNLYNSISPHISHHHVLKIATRGFYNFLRFHILLVVHMGNFLPCLPLFQFIPDLATRAIHTPRKKVSFLPPLSPTTLLSLLGT